MGTRSIVVDLRGGDLTVIVGCRGAARDLARVIGFDPVDQTRIATAVSEIVRNAVQYAPSATLTMRQVEAPGRRGLEIVVEDRGPGIADLERVLRGGYSTAGGLGLGIAGARQLMDEFEIESAPSRGTRVRMCKWLPLPEAPVAAGEGTAGPGEAERGAATGTLAAVGVAGRGAGPLHAAGVAALAEATEAAAADVDGMLAVQHGRVVFYPPAGTGRLPTIRPGAHVTVLVNGTEVKRIRVIRPGDRIEVRVQHDEPAVDLRVEVSPDGLEAKLHIERRPGTRYALADQAPTTDLTVVAVPVEKVPPPAVSREELVAALKAAGVTYGIDEMALRAAQTSTESGSLVVARGLPPIPSKDGRIELHFENAPYVLAEPPEEAPRVDPLSLYRVSTVAPGQLLATKHPPRPGHVGRKVTGELIPVARPKDVTLRAGPGAMLDEEGRRVYAARGGRPTFQRGVVAVLPLHAVYGDVGPETGHIAFDGDVLVTGNVNEGMRVQSAGRVMVGGIVSGAEVRAEEGVTVGRGIVRSRVVAGGSATVALQLASAIRPVHRQLEQLVAGVRFFKQQAGGAPRIAALGDAPVVRAVMDRKFPGLPRLVEGLLPLADQAALIGVERFEELAAALYRMLGGRGSREAVSVDELAECSRKLGELLEHLGAYQTQPADVVARYIHNAEVHASGTVRVPSGACHYAKIRAGKGFVMGSGVFRGDEIVVREGSIVLDEVGSPQGTKVWVEVVEKGEVMARLVHPGVTVAIGGHRHDFLTQARFVRVRPTEAGPLEVVSEQGGDGERKRL